jgi:aminoglycoside phosphotransferase (APT) family kinase protein
MNSQLSLCIHIDDCFVYNAKPSLLSKGALPLLPWTRTSIQNPHTHTSSVTRWRLTLHRLHCNGSKYHLQNMVSNMQITTLRRPSYSMISNINVDMTTRVRGNDSKVPFSVHSVSDIDEDVLTHVAGGLEAPLPAPGEDLDMTERPASVVRQPRHSNFFRSLLGSQSSPANGGNVRLRLKQQIVQLMANLFPEYTDGPEPELVKIGNGSYNVVFGIRIAAPHPRLQRQQPFMFLRLFGMSPQGKDLALRLPIDREGILAQTDITRDVATLAVISRHLDLPVPKVVSYELSSDNIMTRPYMLQERIRGDSLVNVWKKLNLAQKISVVKQLTVMIEQIAAITTPGAGVISNANIEFPSSSIQVEQFPVPSKAEIKRRTASIERNTFTPPEPEAAPSQTVLDYWLSHIKRWIDYDVSIGKYDETCDLWAALKIVVNGLNRSNWLGSRFHLTHGDLFARNIMAVITSPSTVEITAIIDWDMACFAPQVVALRAPFWAWMSAGESEWDEDVVIFLCDTNEQEALKDAFDEEASADFWRCALSHEAIIARKLFSVTTSGLLTKTNADLARDLCIQWDELHPEDGLGQFEIFYG